MPASCPAPSPGVARRAASGCAGSPTGLRSAMLDQGYTEVEQAGPEVAVVLHFVDPDAARPVPAQERAHLRGRARRAAVATRRRAPHRLPAARAGVGEPVHHVEPRRRRLRRRLRHARAGHVRRRHQRRRRRVLLQDGVLPRRAARDVAAGDRERVHRRPAARAVRRRRDHPSDHACRASGSAHSTCCRPRSRSRRSCPPATSAT